MKDLKDNLYDKQYVIEEENENLKFIKFRKIGHNDFFCIQICTVFLRLVRFDDYERHPSDENYNNYFHKVDELFSNLENLFTHLSTFN